jgi:hypothetical protein
VRITGHPDDYLCLQQHEPVRWPRRPLDRRCDLDVEAGCPQPVGDRFVLRRVRKFRAFRFDDRSRHGTSVTSSSRRGLSCHGGEPKSDAAAPPADQPPASAGPLVRGDRAVRRSEEALGDRGPVHACARRWRRGRGTQGCSRRCDARARTVPPPVPPHPGQKVRFCRRL